MICQGCGKVITYGYFWEGASIFFVCSQCLQTYKGIKVRKKMGIEKIREIQEKRFETFPEDRIPFYNGGTAIQEDQRNMLSYQRGEIGIQRLCRLIEKSNFLPERSVSPEMMRNELRHIGYARVSDRK